MDRRAFLRTLTRAAIGAAVTGSVLDPEKALWIPGQRTIIDLGAGRAPISPHLVTMRMITAEALRVLKGNLALVDRVYRNYDEHAPGPGQFISVNPPPEVKIVAPGEIVEFIKPELAGRFDSEKGWMYQVWQPNTPVKVRSC